MWDNGGAEKCYVGGQQSYPEASTLPQEEKNSHGLTDTEDSVNIRFSELLCVNRPEHNDMKYSSSTLECVSTPGTTTV